MTNMSLGPRPTDLSVSAAWAACIIIYAGVMGMAAFAPSFLEGPPHDYEFGFLEQFGNVILVVALVAMVWAIYRADSMWLRAWMILVTLGTIYVLGEEASWGQHYFHWQTTGWFASHNDQGETNLHNTSSWFDQKPRAVLQLGVIVGGILHPLVKRFRNGRGLFDNPWWLAPTVACLPAALFSILAGVPKAVDKLHLLPFELHSFRSSEFEELFFYTFFVTYMLSLLIRLKARRTRPAM